MDERKKPDVEEFLRRGEVQERIKKNIRRVHEESTVTIGRAAKLFNFSENQLRDWEENDLLTPLRPPGGQRQYTYEELAKLAIIRELINARYAPGDIPPNVSDIWEENISQTYSMDEGKGTFHTPIDTRITQVENQAFQHFWVSRILRLSLMLVCENAPEGTLGIILPLQTNSMLPEDPKPENLSTSGRSLVGWLSQNGSFSTFIDNSPTFEYPSDFRIHRLKERNENAPTDGTLIVMQRKAVPFEPNLEIVETIRRLLSLIYQSKHEWQIAFGQGMRDFLDPLTSLYSNSISTPDVILSQIADEVVKLSRDMSNNKTVSPWCYCCILLPQESILPQQQRSLVVYAQSKYGPHKVGVTTLHPTHPSGYLSLTTFKSGKVLYRSMLKGEKTAALIYRELEGMESGSVIAVPVGGENGNPRAVLYVVSDNVDGFTNSDIRLLRVIARIVEELLINYGGRQQVSRKLIDLIQYPQIIDMSFRDFFSENQFLSDVKEFLGELKRNLVVKVERAREENPSVAENFLLQKFYKDHPEEKPSQQISFIAVDVDNYSAIVSKYDERVARNLSREIGLKIQGHFRAIVRRDDACKVYHIYADRFYILMKSIDGNQAKKDAQRLGKILSSSYLIDSRNDFVDQPTLPNGKIPIDSVSVRLAVTSYLADKLEEILLRYPPETRVAEVSTKISITLDDILRIAMDKNGGVVVAWDHDKKDFVTLKFDEELPDEAETPAQVSSPMTR